MADHLGTAIVGILVLLALLVFVRYPQRPNLPGPKGAPLVGVLPSLVEAGKRGGQHLWIQKMNNEYGPVVGCQFLFGEPVIICGKGSLIKEVLKNNVGDGKINRFEGFVDSIILTVGRGLITLQGDQWRHHRRLVLPTFNTRRLRAVVGMSIETVDRFMDSWRNQIEEQKATDIEVNMHDVTNHMALDVLMEAVFSLNPEEHAEDYQNVSQAVHGLTSATNARIMIPKPFWGLALNDQAQVKAMGETMEKFVQSVIKKRLEKGDAGEDGDIVSIMVHEMLKHRDSGFGAGFTEEDIVNETAMFFAAGHETTGNTLCNILYRISNRPDLQQKMREEAVSARVDEHGYDAMEELPLIGAVINETLRVHPTTPITGRRAATDMDIEGVHFPKGAMIFLNFNNANLNEEYWGPDAKEFRPERWLETPNWTPKPGNFFGFGSGPQGCIGERLSRLEMKTVLAKLLTNFRFSPGFDWKDPNQHPKATISVTVGFKSGCPIRVTPIEV
eukprot:Clim_evm13s162 gene=Clim_evmTU13s162